MAKYNISIANLKGNANKQPEFSYASCVGRGANEGKKNYDN